MGVGEEAGGNTSISGAFLVVTLFPEFIHSMNIYGALMEYQEAHGVSGAQGEQNVTPAF